MGWHSGPVECVGAEGGVLVAVQGRHLWPCNAGTSLRRLQPALRWLHTRLTRHSRQEVPGRMRTVKLRDLF